MSQREPLVLDVSNTDLSAALPLLRESGSQRALIVTRGRDRAAETELRARARRDGFGPYDLAFVDRTATTRTIAGLRARLAATPADEPSRVALNTNSLSRTTLLRLASAVELAPVAYVDENLCAGINRCGRCAAACPADAIDADSAFAKVSSHACDACGACLAACPVGAIHIGGASPAQLEAQLAELLQAPVPGLVFACTRSDAPYAPRSDGWAVIELTGLAVLSPERAWRLLDEGVSKIELAPCEGDCCEMWREGGPNLDLFRALERIGLPRADVRVLHPAASHGILEIDGGCTTCGACSTACPTGALRLDETESEVQLVHDPASCTGCSLCVSACPENVLHVERGLDTARIRRGTYELASSRTSHCRRCGDPLPAPQVTARNRELLAARWPALRDAAPDLCIRCALL